MKKLYMLVLVSGLGTLLHAQNDVSVTLNNYTSGQATSDDPLDMTFTITNEAATAVPTGDTIYFGFYVGTSNYAIDLTPGGVTYVVLTADLPAGGTIDLSGLSTPPSTMDMQWIYAELGALNGSICGFAGVGLQSLYLTPGEDANYLDNTMCVDYTVTHVTGIDGEEKGTISAYPNPATTTLTFDLAGHDIDQISIFDISGREVANLNVTGSIESVNTEDFENGVYFYQLINDGEVVKTNKFSVVK